MDKTVKLFRHVFVLSLLVITGWLNIGNGEIDHTKISIKGDKWFINDKITNENSPAEGLLMNVRMVNAVFEDISDKLPNEFRNFDPDKNVDSFISKIPEYINSGVNGFTISLQGGMPGYEGAVNSAYDADGNLRDSYMGRVAKVIKAVDDNNGIVILSCFYQRQHSNKSALKGKQAIFNALGNTVRWIRTNHFRNVVLEVSNEYKHGGFLKWENGSWLISDRGQIELISLSKSLHPSLIVSTSGVGDGQVNDSLIKAVDFISVHFNNTSLNDYAQRINEAKRAGKPVICNEDDKTGAEGASALVSSVINGCGWGYMNSNKNQYMPFMFDGSKDDPLVYDAFKKVTTPGYSIGEYFPPSDSAGGWRTINDPAEIRKLAGLDKEKMDSVFDFVRTTTSNGGLLVVRHGWLVYERYFGKGHRDATPNLGSCGKPFTSISMGILMKERPDLFKEGLDQKIFTPGYLPEEAFPLPDSRMKDIKLGQLLSFSAGIRGNNPVYVDGKMTKINPVGPDGWYSLVDEYALGIKDGKMGNTPFSNKTLWCEPGGGYSYATSSIHVASIMLRFITGMELEEYIDLHLARPLGWGQWGFGYKNQPMVNHTPGGGGIALRSTDMLRFCYMLLHGGRWGDDQIVPKEYVSEATVKSRYNTHYPYSLQFNVNTGGDIKDLPKDAFWKLGSGGHCFLVVPSLDLIVWKPGGRDGQYSFSDTGLPEPIYPSEIIQPINDGHPRDADNDAIRMMIMAVRSVVD